MILDAPADRDLPQFVITVPWTNTRPLPVKTAREPAAPTSIA